MRYWAVEGNTQWLDGGAMFGNAPKELWKKWITPDEKNRLHMASRTLLIETDEGKRILFDAGVGVFFEPKLKERYGVYENEHMLIKNLEQIGFDHHDVHAVVLSHLHFDHCGGLLSHFEEGEPHLLFPNATYYVGKRHWERAQNPHRREKTSFLPHLHHLLKESGRLKYIEEAAHPELPNITFHFFDGHTVGLLVSEIKTSEGSLVFLSDLAPGKPWIHTAITMGYDRFAELVVNEKTEFLELLHKKKAKVCFVHDLETSFATIQKNEKGKFFAK